MEDNIDIEKYAQKLRMELDEALGRNEELSEEISDHARMLEKTLDNLAGGVGIFELHGNKPAVRYMSKSFYKLFNVTEDQMSGYASDYVMLAIPEDRSALKKQILETITSNKTTVRDIRFTDVNTGGYFWIQVCLSVMSIKKGIIALCAVFIDVTSKMEAELENKAQSEMLRLILQGSGESIIVYDVPTDTLINEKVVDGEMVTTMKYENFYKGIDTNRIVHADDRDAVTGMFRKILDADADSCDRLMGDLRLDLDGGGKCEWYRVLFVPLRDSKKKVRKIFGKYYSINDEKIRSQELQLRAERDSLTGLYNHVTFQHKITDMLESFPGELCAFYIMDIDDFKHINDAFGHYAGDDLLCDVAVTLEEVASAAGGFSGRLGGDEFALFIPIVDRREDVYKLAENIQTRLTTINCSLPHTMSMGISIHRIEGGIDFDLLYSESDQELYAAKRGGKNRYCDYADSADMHSCDSHHSGYTYNDDEGLMLDEISDIAYVADMKTHEMYFLNKAAKRSLGIAENDDSYKGKKCFEIAQGGDDQCPFCSNEILVPGQSYVWNHYNSKAKGLYVVKDKIVDWHGRKSRLEIAVDVSDIDKTTQVLADSYDIEDALVNFMANITSKQSSEEKYTSLLEVMGTFYNSKNACLVEYGQDGTGELYYWKSSDEESIEDGLKALVTQKMRDELEKEVLRDEVLIVDRSHPLRNPETEFARMLSDSRIWSLYAVPIIVDDELLGRVFVFNPEKHNGNIRLMKNFAAFIGSEIYQRHLKEDQQFEFTHDKQTKCFNRNSYIDYIRGRKNLSSIGLVAVDINEIRGIAEMFGPDYADDVILQLVGRIRKTFPDDRVFRMGYDSFIIICENIEQLKFNVYASRLRENLLYGEFTACCGYVWTDCNIDVRRMEDHAANLLYSEKQRWYEQQDCHSVKWNTLKKDMVKKELEEGLFYVLYQPKMLYPSGKICGAEALVRYSGNDDLADVIDRLEKSRTVKYVDFYVLENVCRDLAKWHEEGMPYIPVSCNFSRMSLIESDVAKQIAAVVDRYGIPHDVVEIEITESVSEQEHDTLVNISNNIHELGFRIAMDDFGTKYSNVAMLAHMGFDIIKFDKSMINDITVNPVDRTVMCHLINMFNELGMFCIAEGVETEDQADVLSSIGLACIQGYLCSRPLEKEKYVEMCRERGISQPYTNK